jgi:hypothetical protein
MRRLLPIFCLFACLLPEDNRPLGALDEPRFVGVYCDLLEESLRSRNVSAEPDTALSNAAAVLNRKGISRDAFESTYNWYNEDITRWKNFMEEVTRELERREATPTPRP